MQDHFGHRISYLRVSVTDRCNERCSYCMPDELQEWLPRADVLTFPETLRLIRVGAQLGIDKIRVTGGEPLTRKGVTEFLGEVTAVNGIKRVGVSTNGTLLARAGSSGSTIAEEIRAAGVDSLNISLDTLDRAVYQRITGRDFLPRVLEGIEAAIEARFPQIKLNAVLMRGRNEDGLLALIDFAGERKLLLRFIELMPVRATEVLNESNFFPISDAWSPLAADEARAHSYCRGRSCSNGRCFGQSAERTGGDCLRTNQSQARDRQRHRTKSDREGQCFGRGANRWNPGSQTNGGVDSTLTPAAIE